MRPEPYAHEHVASVESLAAREAQPRTIHGFVEFFRPRWEQETPVRLHVDEVWRTHGAPGTVPAELQGGSKLGTPAYANDFRRLLESSAFELTEDGAYVRPCRAALHSLLYRGHGSCVRRMFALARSGWDVFGTMQAEGLDREDGLVLYREGLHLWWRAFSERPLDRRVK